MASLWSLLSGLPTLISKLFDLLAEAARRRERQQMKDEAAAAAAVEIEMENIKAARERQDAMDRASAVLPDRAAVTDSLRRDQF